MKKTQKGIEYYLSMPYTIEIQPSPEGGYGARVVELPGCISQGMTLLEAVEMIEDAKRAWLESALEEGISIPEPETAPGYSGKLLVRMPKSLHESLARQAKKEGVSLNQLVLYYLARQAGTPLRGGRTRN